MRIARLSLGALLGFVMGSVAFSANARADVRLQTSLGRFAQALRENDDDRLFLAKNEILAQVFVQTDYRENKSRKWDDTTRAIYQARLLEIRDTFAHAPEAAAELAYYLQVEWERQALSAEEIYHLGEGGRSATSHFAEFVVSSSVLMLTPTSSAAGFARGSAIGARLSKARAIMTGVAAGATTIGFASNALAVSELPPSPAELLPLAGRLQQDLRWQEDAQELKRKWISDGAGAGVAGLYGLATTKAIAAGGGLGTLAGGSALAATGIGAAVLAGGVGSFWFAEKIAHQRLTEERRSEVITNFKKQYRNLNLDQLATVTRLLHAVAELEAFFYRDYLLGDAQSRSLKALQKGLQRKGISLPLEASPADDEKSLAEFWSEQFKDAPPRQFLKMEAAIALLQSASGISDICELRKMVTEMQYTVEMRQEMMALVKRYTALQALSRRVPHLSNWLQMEERELLAAQASHLRQTIEASDADASAELVLSDVAGVLRGVGATLLSATSPRVRDYGLQLSLRGKMYIQSSEAIQGATEPALDPRISLSWYQQREKRRIDPELNQECPS